LIDDTGLVAFPDIYVGLYQRLLLVVAVFRDYAVRTVKSYVIFK